MAIGSVDIIDQSGGGAAVIVRCRGEPERLMTFLYRRDAVAYVLDLWERRQHAQRDEDET